MIVQKQSGGFCYDTSIFEQQKNPEGQPDDQEKNKKKQISLIPYRTGNFYGPREFLCLFHNSISPKSLEKLTLPFIISRACHQLKDFVAKMAGFENRIAEYLRRI